MSVDHDLRLRADRSPLLLGMTDIEGALGNAEFYRWCSMS